MEEETYLGDGVYARYDGEYIWLYTSNGIVKSPEIALEPMVYCALTAFAGKVWRAPE